MKKVLLAALPLVLILIMSACSESDSHANNKGNDNNDKSDIPASQETDDDGGYLLKSDVNNINDHLDYTDSELEKIYFAGGCFWGVEAYMQQIYGVKEVHSGYANGDIDDPSYEDVIQGDSGFAEAVEVTYDPERINLETLVDDLFLVIDPTSENKQGNDVGEHYRTGIYPEQEDDLDVIQRTVDDQEDAYDDEIVTEVEPLENFYLAEEEHQDYLEKNPNGYCHVDLTTVDDLAVHPIEEDEEIIKEFSQ